MLFKKLSIFLFVLFLATKLYAAEQNKNNGQQLNFFTGNFDFSDDKQSAYLVGFQHQDQNLSRDTFLGNVSPITGGFLTENSAAYIYTGIEWNMNMGEKLFFTPRSSTITRRHASYSIILYFNCFKFTGRRRRSKN